MSLKDFLYKNVRVITTDARLFEGKLEGFDNSTNIVISGCIERIVKTSQSDYQELEMGLYVMRGTNIVCIGEIDDTVEVDWQTIIGHKLNGTKNPL